MARLGTPGQPDPRVEGKIELGELIMAFLRFDFDTAGSLEVNHGGCADEFLADHDGFHSVQAGSGLILRQLDTVAGNDKGRRVVPGQVFGEIGRASCRERVCQYVLISVVAEPLKKKKHTCLIMSM